MSISYKSNAKRIFKKLKKRSDKTVSEIRSGMTKGLRLFEARIVRQQLSGRKGPKGLYRRSGNAAESWVIDTKISGKDVIASLGSRAFYLETHQRGMEITPRSSNKLVFKIGDRTIFADRVKIPKRLYIEEDFKKNGTRIIKRAILKELAKRD